MPSDQSELLVRQVVTILSEVRQQKGLSMNKLAWMSGVSAKGIAFIEQGKNSPTLRNISRLAIALDLSMSQLLVDAEKRLDERKKG